MDRHEWTTADKTRLAITRQGDGAYLEVDWTGRGFEVDTTTGWSPAFMREILRLAAELDAVTKERDEAIEAVTILWRNRLVDCPLAADHPAVARAMAPAVSRAMGRRA